MKKKQNKKIDQLAHSFYMSVFAYINKEYKPKYAKLFADSEISPQIYTLCSQYYWGGNTVPFTSGQIVDLLKSKYKSV
jgi:hypothetical protein